MSAVDADAGRRAPPESRLVVAGVFLATLALASLLLFVRVRSTEILLDVMATTVSFTSLREQAILPPMLVGTMSAGGLRASTGLEVGAARDVSDSSAAIQLMALVTSLDTGTISLDRIVVPAGTRVTFARTDVPRQYRLSLRSARPVAATVHADLLGGIDLRSSSSAPLKRVFTSPRAIDLGTTTNDLDLHFTLPALAAAVTIRQVDAADLQLHEVVEDLAAPRPDARVTSAVESGSIWFESLAGQARALHAGELVRLDSARGTIQAITLGAELVSMRFQGEVRGLRSGYGDAPRTLMPTLLDTLRAREGEKLLWATALYVFGSVMAVRRWWRRPA